MNYIILDLEWNQALSGEELVRRPVPLYGEIIQIGAVKTDESFNLTDKIKINVRPKFYTKMNPFVRKITGITETDLTFGEVFPRAWERFSKWCGEEYRVITWGFDDIGIFNDNLKLYGKNTAFGKDFINLQLIYNKQTKAEHLQCGLSAAAEKLGIPIDFRVHDAANDAYLTYEVLKKLDMVKGIADYSEMSTAAAVALSKDYFEMVNPAEMISDSRVADIKCPFCKADLQLREWLFGNSRSCRNIAKCEEHGAFLVKLKALRITDDNFTVTRSVYAADEEDILSYERKLKKRAEIIERRKAEAWRKG